MNPLIIAYQHGIGAGWYAFVPNTNIQYFFEGVNQMEQLQSARAFAQSLANGNAAIAQFFEPDGVAPGVIEEELFGETDYVVFGAIEGPAAAAGEYLFSILADVGTFLLGCL